MDREISVDVWVLLSPFLAIIGLCVLWNMGVAARLMVRLWQMRRVGEAAPPWGRWLRWGGALFASGAWFLAWDLPRLAPRFNFFATSDGETVTAVGVIMGTLYAGLALVFGSALFFLAGVEARADGRKAAV